MTEDELTAWVALHSVEGIGAASLGRLLARFGTARGVLAASPEEREAVPQVPGLVLEGIRRAAREPEPHRAVAERLVAQGVGVVQRGEPRYPSRLHALASPPPLLYVLGRLPADARRTVGIVGSTAASPQGLRAATAAARALATAGWVIVSGHARGIDAAAHGGAFQARGATVLVLPTGALQLRLRAGYPPMGDFIRRAAALSEFHPEAPWATRAALTRNRLIAALSDAVVVVETREEGGALSTLRHALALGRRGFVVRFRRPALSAAGNAVAEQLGAQPARSVRDLLRRLAQPRAKDPQPELPWR
jgi:DNA processing protein